MNLRASKGIRSISSAHRMSRDWDAKDASLVAMLASKPEEQIPPAAWWFVADSLRSAVQVRRSMLGAAPLQAADFLTATERARRAAQAALEELAVGPWSPESALGVCQDCERPAATLRVTIRELALLVVTTRVTEPRRLQAAICVHLDALSRCDLLHASPENGTSEPGNNNTDSRPK
jgi:hypothetical protein